MICKRSSAIYPLIVILPDNRQKVNKKFWFTHFQHIAQKISDIQSLFYKVAKTAQNARFSQLFEKQIGQIWSRFFLKKLRETLFFAVKHRFWPLKVENQKIKFATFFGISHGFLHFFAILKTCKKGVDKSPVFWYNTFSLEMKSCKITYNYSLPEPHKKIQICEKLQKWPVFPQFPLVLDEKVRTLVQ